MSGPAAFQRAVHPLLELLLPGKVDEVLAAALVPVAQPAIGAPPLELAAAVA